jgi:Tfp pilus assembly protein PilF
MNKFAVLGVLLAWMPFSAALASSASQARAAQFSGASDELQADIPEHRASWKISMERALGYVKNGDFVEAQKMVDMARKEANAIGQSDPSLAETEKMAGDIFLAQNNLDSAERSYRRSVYLFGRAISPDKSEFAAALSSYASFLKNSNRIREASKFEARANLLRGNDNSTAESNRSL